MMDGVELLVGEVERAWRGWHEVPQGLRGAKPRAMVTVPTPSFHPGSRRGFFLMLPHMRGARGCAIARGASAGGHSQYATKAAPVG